MTSKEWSELKSGDKVGGFIGEDFDGIVFRVVRRVGKNNLQLLIIKNDNREYDNSTYKVGRSVIACTPNAYKQSGSSRYSIKIK